MDTPLASAPPRHTDDDLSALAWVQDELRRSLESAHKSLRRFLREAGAHSGADVDALDPSVLRAARHQIHQGVGALELVGLPAVASVLRAAESMVQRCAARPQRLDEAVVEAVERASFGVLDFIARTLAGRPVSPLSLFPQYRALLELAGADRVHPADLWRQDWRWHELPREPGIVPRQPDAATRARLEQQLLALMRGPVAPAAARMSELCTQLAAGTGDAHAATLWQLAAAFFEGQAQGLLQPDVFGKRVASRLLAQVRSLERGDTAVSERLAQDLLFFCAQCESPGDGRHAPRLAAVREAWDLAHHRPIDYTASTLGRFDPALLLQARKRLAGAKEVWSAVSGGEMHRVAGLAEQFTLVGDSLRRLYPHGEELAQEFMATTAEVEQGRPVPPALAMEVATSLLYLDASLEDGAVDLPHGTERLQRLVARIAAVRAGGAAEPLEPWMEELYRRVSDRQTMGSVMHELRASLSEAEQAIDQFFRDPGRPEVLIPVPNQLSAMRGVLSVLGLDHASQALLRMRDEIDAFIVDAPQDEAQAGTLPGFERIADNLGALGFLIDMLSVQPQMAKSLFAFDADTGVLAPVMGRAAPPAEPDAGSGPVEPRLVEQVKQVAHHAAREDIGLEDLSFQLDRLSNEAQLVDHRALLQTVSRARAALDRAADEATRSELRGQLAEALGDFVATASEPVDLQPLAAPPVSTPQAAVPPGPAPRASAVPDHGGEGDDEMREVFLEEAREVIGEARAAQADLVRAPDDLSLLTTVRRAFHTLKGSSRMVGLAPFGEAAWACEQVYNTRLGEQRPADEALLGFTGVALAHLSAWVEGIASGQGDGEHGAAVIAAARAHAALAAPSAAEAAPAGEALEVITLDLGPEAPPPAAEPVEPAEPVRLVAEDSVPDTPAPLGEPAGASDAPPVFDLDFSLPDTPLDLPAAAEGPERDAKAPLPQAEPPAHEPSLYEVPDLELPELLDGEEARSGPASLYEVPDIQLPEAPDLGRSDDEDEAAPFLPDAAAAFADAAAAAEPPEPEPAVADAPPAEAGSDDPVKLVGPLRIPIPLFNIYLNEADELSRRLSTELAEWTMELHRPVGELPVTLAHSLAGSSATVGFSDLSQLARALEHALMRSQAAGSGNDEEAQLFVEVAEEIRRLLHQFAAGFLKQPLPALLRRLASHEAESARRPQADAEAAPAEPQALAVDLDLADAWPTEPPPAVPAGADRPADEPPAAVPVPAAGPAPLKALQALPPEAARREAGPDDAAAAGFEDIDAVDAIDAELFPIFAEEATELLPQLASRLRDWARRPGDSAHAAAACMRSLHTLKGGARLAGAMRLGEMAHRLETRIEALSAQAGAEPAEVEALQGAADALAQAFERLQSGGGREAGAGAEDEARQETAGIDLPLPEVAEAPLAEAGPATGEERAALPAEPVEPAPTDLPDIDWSRFVPAAEARPAASRERAAPAVPASVRVRAPLLERMVNQAGEVSITRARIEVEVRHLRDSLNDLTENLERLRQQMRDIELQAETQMSSRLEAAKASDQAFDPLEFDRFTRFQELTRMMAESVNDVATVQRSLQRTLDSTEDELAAQARLTRDLQDDLLRTRMVEFEGLSDRLYRVVRQAAKETGKQVRLDIVGGSIEVDRGVLDRMTPAFEHLLRNCVTHGIESAARREAAGKPATGTIIVAVAQEGNEVGVEFRDDGAGLDLAGIRDRAIALGLIDASSEPGDGELAELIFQPGFSTAASVTELSGRGVGMDVVRSDVNAMGGRIETASEAGKGTSFKLVLPLTTAVTQVVMLRVGDSRVAVPSTLVETVRRARPEELAHAYASGSYDFDDETLPFFWLGALLQQGAAGAEAAQRTRAVVIIRSAQQRVAVHVDEVLGNQEVVVKNLGPQLSRLPGLAGMTLLPSGDVALIYNPVALAALYGDAAREATRAALQGPAPGTPLPGEVPAAPAAPLILVVDDSLTVRRVTQRLLQREGYRVALAKDGLEALERLAEQVPQVVLSDIEMPRMDGFDLVRNIRGDARLSGLPVIMITSRIAQKHRDYAAELGVDHYLGKPYSEEDLLALIARYTAAEAPA